MKSFFTQRTLQKTKILKGAWVAIFTLLACTHVNAQRFTHPGIPFTSYDLNQLKANITKEPWLSAYNAFKGDGHSQLDYWTNGPFATVTRAPNLNNTRWINDMIAVRNLAFMWIFTGDSAYARKATNLLDAWAVTNTVWGGNESMLDIGDYADCWATGADILKSTFPGWTDSNTVHVKNYFANVLYPTSWVPWQLRDANKGALQLKIALSAAAFCDDAIRFNQAIDVYRMDAGGGMRNSLTNGEVGDAGRDDHWRVQAAALAWGAEVAYKQGIDMFAELDNRVLAIAEMYHRYNFEGDTMTFIPFGGYASYWTGWGIPTHYAKGDMTNIILGAYKLRKGIPTPYTDQLRAALGGAGGDFLYLKSSDTSTATVLPPVFYPAEHTQPVSHLTNTDIGSPGIAGSASYSNGVWTVKAAGNSTSSAFNFNFKKMSGDAGLVVKVNSMSLSSSGCGVMIRQSLAPGAPFWDIYLAATGGVGRHWQPKAPWWLKIERVGNRIFTYHSQDGVNWTGINCFYTSSSYPAELYYGFYTISNNTSALNTAIFTNVAFSQAAPTGSPEISSATSATVKIGTPFSYSITASGNPAAYNAGGLPAGLTLNAATGIISGTPTTLGQSEVTLGATNSSGTGTATLILNVTSNAAPNTPDSAVAAVVNTTQIKLTWKQSANATSYSVKRSLTPGGPYTTIQTGITGASFTDAVPTPEVNNYYVVTALADELESGLSNEVFASVPPAIPGKPTVTNKNGQVDLKWDTAYGASSYKVKRGTVSGGSYTTIATVTSNSYTDMNVTNGSPYYYVVSAVGATKESANSPEAYAVPGSNSLTWSADPDSTTWSQASGWVENSVPQSPAIITFKSSADTVITNDLTDLVVSRIQFDADASQYTIGGNSMALNNDLVNNSSKWQTITNPLVVNQQLSVATNTNGIALSGNISGTGSIRKTGSGILDMSGNNTYSGGTIITGAIGGWPPSNGIGITGDGTGTPSNPTSGPLGTGKIIFNGGGLWAAGGDVTLYNDLEAPAGQSGWFFECCHALNLRGKLTGSGTFIHDGNVYAGLHLFADNSGFTGTFISKLRSGNSRTCFEVPESGSAKAHWLLDANGNDCHRILFGSGTLHFGGLTGRGFLRNDAGGSPVVSIGALNTDCWFAGIFDKYFLIEKVGTGTLWFAGNHTYGGTTTIKNGKFLVVNNPTNGTFPSPVVDSSGTFGGTGLSQGTVTIGTGTAATAILEPGNGGIGTFTTTSSLTINNNGIYKAQISSKNATADKMKAGSVSLAGNPVLSVADIDSGALALGTNLTILENTGTNAISGTFKDLPELSVIKVGSYDFRITYKGGDGNDVVLMDERAVSIIITSSKADTTLIGRPYQYTITGIKSPNHFTASGLPEGLSIDTTTGVISGTPAVYGNFNVVLTAANDTISGTDTLRLVVLNYVTSNITVAEADARVVVEWNSILNFSYKVKRSTSASGPFTVIGNTTTARYTDSLLTNGATYYYTVTAVDSSTEYPESAPVAATPKLGQWGYWKFNEASGTKAYDIWGANHGVLQVAATRDTGYVSGGLKLNGAATSYALLPNGIFSTVNDFTAMAWIKPKSLSTWMRVFDFGSSTNQYFFLTPQGGVTSDNKQIVRYAIKNNGTEQGLNVNYAIPLNDWTHLAVTQSGNTCTIYINGVAAVSGSITIKPSNLGSTTQNYVGKSQWADPMYNGIIDELKVYNRALSKSELNAAAGIFADTAMKAKSYKYTVVSPISSPTQFTATGLPSGFIIDANGVISGTTDTTGQYKVVVTASNGTTAGISTLYLEVLDNKLKDVLVAAGDSKAIAEWNALLGLSYSVKRSTSANGPFTVVGTTTATQYTDNGLANGTTYYYQVVAKDSATEYASSSIVAATPGLGQWDSWKFNDSTGTRAVDSWGARHGMLTGGTSFTTGLQGKAVQLNGSTGYVALPSGIMTSVNDFTIAGWVKLNAGSTWSRIFDFGSGQTNYMFLTPISGNNTVRYAIKVNGGTEQQINSTSPLPAGEWHHVAVTLSGLLGTLYIDGVAVGTNTNMSNKPSALNNTTQNYIGKSQFSSDAYLNAIVDEFRIYNRALSATELKTVYTQYAPPLPPTNLVVTVSNNQPALSWTASTGATGYNVKRSGTLAGPYTTIATATSASYTDSSAAGCATYFYMVSAGNGNGESANSSIATSISKKLTGIVIGTAGAFGTSGNTKEKAVDGSLSTYFDGPAANGVWVGYDLGADSTQAVYKVRYAPRATFGSRMVGGVFQGSNVASFSTATTLFTITATPVDNVYTEQMITSTAPFRYIRYLSPNNGYGNVAEVEFYGIPSAAVPQITSKAGMKNLSYGAAFSYTIPATNANNFSATGLPDGLSVNACTGAISGTLNAAGTFPVILTASSTLGSAKDTMQLIIKKDQSITFNTLQQKKIGDADFDAGAVASSGLPVSYTSSDTTVARIVNGLVHIAGRGTTTITASQSGDSIYKAATAVTQQLVVYQLPTVKTQNITASLDESGNASITPQQVDDGSVSYSGALSLSLDKTNFTCSDIGAPVTVTFTATDADGHSTTGTAQVTVVDDIDPTITVSDVSVNADNGACAAGNVSLGTPVTADNCGVQSVTNDAPASFPVGTTTVIWTITDMHGNTATATQQVTVVDNQKPAITAPLNVNVNADNGSCAATNVVLGIPVTNDNCGVQSISNDAPLSFPVGTTVVTWMVTDIHGNQSTATQTVTVTDNQQPILTATSSQVFCYNSIGSYTVPALNASDNCGIASINYTVSGATSRSGSGTDASGAFNPGQSTITWSVTDVHGNQTAASTVVTVNTSIIASIADVYAMSPAVDAKNTIYLGYGPASLPVTASVTGGTAPYTYSWNTGAAASSINASVAGTYVVTVTDAKGCTSTASTVISLLDVRCGNNNDKVTICHNNNTICVASSAVQTHLDHGDHLGACGARMDVTDAAVQPGVSVAQLAVYPNPSEGQFVVKLEGFKPGKAAMIIMDGNGKLIQQKSILLSADKQTVPVNLYNCATGIYFLRILTNGETKTEKLIIKR